MTILIPRRGVLLWPNTIAIIITVASLVMFLLLHKTALPFASRLVKPDLTRIWNFRIPPFPILLLVNGHLRNPRPSLLSIRIITILSIRLVGTSGGSLTVRMSGWRSGNTKILIYVFHSMLRSADDVLVLRGVWWASPCPIIVTLQCIYR